MTPQELLQLKVSGNTTVRDLFYGAVEDGAFGADEGWETDEAETAFYEQLAQKIIDAVKG